MGANHLKLMKDKENKETSDASLQTQGRILIKIHLTML